MLRRLARDNWKFLSTRVKWRTKLKFFLLASASFRSYQRSQSSTPWKSGAIESQYCKQEENRRKASGSRRARIVLISLPFIAGSMGILCRDVLSMFERRNRRQTTVWTFPNMIWFLSTNRFCSRFGFPEVAENLYGSSCCRQKTTAFRSLSRPPMKIAMSLWWSSRRKSSETIWSMSNTMEKVSTGCHFR